MSFGLPPAAGFGAQTDSVFDGNEADTQQQFAAFGELTIPLASRWDFVAGLRVFHYKQDSLIRYAGIANDGITNRDASTSETGNTPKVQFTYRPTDDATVYVQAAKGFRLGGITEPLATAGVFGTDCANDLSKVGLESLPDRFKLDHLWSFELGGKTRWLNKRLTVNAALLDIEWSNIQTNVFLPCGFITVVNAGKVRSRGGEAEVSWAVMRGLTLSASGSYTNATLVNKTAAFSAEEGDRVPNVPRVNANASAEYRWPLRTSGQSIGDGGGGRALGKPIAAEDGSRPRSHTGGTVMLLARLRPTGGSRHRRRLRRSGACARSARRTFVDEVRKLSSE